MQGATWVLCTAFALAVSAVHAEDENSPEVQAAIKPGEMAQFDRDSIGEYGATRRFDVDVVWSGASGERPTTHKNRKVRYIADCKAGTLTLAAVAVFDRSGMTEKRMMVPPGAGDPFTPQAASPQEKWLRNVCRD
jgi:hypothetical protein